MLSHESSEAKLGEDDMRIVKAIEESGRYKLWGWEVPDFCRLVLIFDDNKSNSRMGVDINIFPVDKEESDG